jgi:hypothetical protein
MEKDFNIEQSLLSKDLMEKLPEWWKHINKEDYYLVMTDDCDSLFSCQRLNTLFGLEIGGFYSFETGLYENDTITDFGWKTPIYVDLSIGQNQLCFDNHRTFMPNSNRVNPNVISREYKNKYNLSTLTFIIGLYGGIEKMNDLLKTMLLAVDGGFIGYYKNNGRWKDVNIYWLNKLGLSEYLLPILESHNMEYFKNFGVEHCLHDKIFINDDGYLETPTYKVPDYKFELKQPVQKIFVSKHDAIQRHKNKENILVSAETYKNDYVLNIAV